MQQSMYVRDETKETEHQERSGPLADPDHNDLKIPDMAGLSVTGI